MMAKGRTVVTSDLLLAYLEGELSWAERTLVEERLASCARTRGLLDQLTRVRERLLSPLTDLPALDLTERVHRRARERRTEREEARARRWWRRLGPRRVTQLTGAWWLAPVASAVTLALVLHEPLRDAASWSASATGGGGTDTTGTGALADSVLADSVLAGSALTNDKGMAEDFRPKATHGSQPWVGFQVYEVGASESPRRITSAVSQTSGLLFSYVNGATTEYRYLMVFARDAAGRVHWFHPAHEPDEPDTASLGITQSSRQVAIPEVIRPNLDPGEVIIYAAFTREPLGTNEVGTWLGEHPGAAFSLPVERGRVEQIRVQVRP